MKRSPTLNLILVGGGLIIAALSLTSCKNQYPEVEPVTETPKGSVPETGNASDVERTPMAPGEDSPPKQGLAISKSDVSNLEDSVLASGEALFIPQEQAADLATENKFDPTDIDSMRYANFQLNKEVLGELGGVVAPIGPDGRFAMEVPPGRYLVCLANIHAGQPSGPPYSVAGCDAIDLPGDASLTMSFGEGGVEATVH